MGRHAAAVGDIEQAIAEFPLREGLRVLLMTAIASTVREDARDEVESDPESSDAGTDAHDWRSHCE